MESSSDLEASEHFFQQGETGTYADGPTQPRSLAPVELELETEPRVSSEQLARAGRFRKPVAIFIGSLAACLLIALGRARYSTPAAQLASAADQPSAHATAQPALTTARTSASYDGPAPLPSRALDQPSAVATSHVVHAELPAGVSAEVGAARSDQPLLTGSSPRKAAPSLTRKATREPPKPAAPLTLAGPAAPALSPTARFPDLQR